MGAPSHVSDLKILSFGKILDFRSSLTIITSFLNAKSFLNGKYQLFHFENDDLQKSSEKALEKIGCKYGRTSHKNSLKTGYNNTKWVRLNLFLKKKLFKKITKIACFFSLGIVCPI